MSVRATRRARASAAALPFVLAAHVCLAQTVAVADPDAGDPEATTAPIGRPVERLRRAAARGLLRTAAADAYDVYTEFKERITRDSGLSWAIDVSWLQQWGLNGGGSPAGQVLATPSINWDLFDSKTFGAGSLQLVYAAARYPTARDAATIQENLGLITPINDYASRQNLFSQLSYTHAFPGKRWLAGVGQFPINNFDDNEYLNDQQVNFNSYILAQNGSATYALAGLGAYVQLTATPGLQFAAGLQNASNIDAATLTRPVTGGKANAWFGYAQWNPKLAGMGSAQYSLLYYQAPTVPAQPRTRGWSLNAVQNLSDTWAVFARANRACEFVTSIRASYALGVAMNNPLGRSATDQIAVALGYSDAAPPPANPPGARNEKILEAYWTWTFGKGLLVTPDVQYIADPALNPTRNGVWILSLRTTLLF